MVPLASEAGIRGLDGVGYESLKSPFMTIPTVSPYIFILLVRLDIHTFCITMIQSYPIDLDEDFIVFKFGWLWYCAQLEAVDAIHQSRPLSHLEDMSCYHLKVAINQLLRLICR
jgi:hypothetical protein